MVRSQVSGSRMRGGLTRPEPYPGWRPFGRAEADRFFGRGDEAAAIARLWSDNRLTILHGSTAVGKTSLISAGVTPLLASGEAAAETVLLPMAELTPAEAPLTPAEAPVSESLIDRNPSSYSLLRAWAHVEGPSIRAASPADFLLSSRDRIEAGRRRRPVLAAIDHFDWILDAPEYERETFIGELADAMNRVPELRLLLVVDDESLPRFRPYPARLWEGRAAFHELALLAPTDALAAVREPLAGTGRGFAPGAAEELVAALGAASGDANDSDGLRVQPLLLQLTCERLWSTLSPADGVITRELVHDHGDIGKALGHFYDWAVHVTHQMTGVAEDQLRGWTEYAFVDSRGARRSAPRRAGLVEGMPHDVVNALVERRFLAFERPPRRTLCRLTLGALAPAVREVNLTWRSKSAPEALDYAPAAIAPGDYAAAARDAFAEGDLSDAQSLAVLAAERFRRSGDERQLAHALMLRGDIACARGDLPHAEENFQEALSRFSVLQDRDQTARTLSALGDIRAMEGDYQRAEEFAQLAVDTRPTDVTALVGLGYAQWYGGSPANAEATFTQALAWDPRATLAMSGRGQVRAEMREYKAALADLDRVPPSALSSEEEADIRSARALALAGLGRREEAERELAEARSKAPRARTLLRSARIAEIEGRGDAAVGDLRRALDARPSLSPAEKEAARRMLGRLTSRGQVSKAG
jgi:tetratricopeptide (TPR) repeat protein